MAKKIFTVEFRRKREGKTNYYKRIKLLSSQKPRLVVRKALKNIIVQLVEYNPKGDIVVASAHSRELIKYGWKLNRGNIPAAYLTGLLLGIKARKVMKNPEAILDLGLQESVKGSRLYAALKGALDAGLNIPHSEEILPEESRISGKHISDYMLKLKNEEPDKFKRFFSEYEKSGVTPEKAFEATKQKILSSAGKK
ncbi:MAG: 50S ribosomal protein L18 [Candidatus Woesearchaeota archaeon]